MFSQSNGLYGVPIQDNQMPNMQQPMMQNAPYANNMQYQQQPSYSNNGYNFNNRPQQQPQSMSNNSYPLQYGASQNPMPYQGYAQGGAVHEMAEEVREHGRNGDTVLAHINPLEQHILKMYGGSGKTNPQTGLPEYGFFNKLEKAFRKPVKGFVKHVLPAVAGTFLGGPAGGLAASTLFGAASRGKGNKLKGALQGALKGAAYGALAPMAGNALGLDPAGFAGRAAGMNSASLLSQLGMSGAPKAGGGLGFIGNGDNTGLLKNMYGDVFSGASGGGGGTGAVAGLAGSKLAGGAGQVQQVEQQGMDGGDGASKQKESPFNGRDLLTHGLLGVGALGTAFRKEKTPKQETLEEYMSRTSSSRFKPKKSRGSDMRYTPLPVGESPGGGAEHRYFEHDFPEYYNQGGQVGGDTNGLTDVVDAKLAPGEYVFMADATSNAGGGNTQSGIKVMNTLHDYLKRGPLNEKKVNNLMKALRS